MMYRPILSRPCVSAFTVSSQGIFLLRLLALLLCLLLQRRPVQGQSFCTIQPRPALIGLGAFPDDEWYGRHTFLSQNGTIAAIGAPKYGSSDGGYVQVVRYENNVWTPLGSTIFGNASTQTTSNALSDDGSVLGVGGLDTTSVRVFRLVDGDWEPLGIDITNPSGIKIGDAIAISGDGTIVAASSPYSSGEVGEVRVFELVEGTWSQKGRTLQGQGEEQLFGLSISLSQNGSVLAVGIPDSIYSLGTTGFVRVFEYINDDWTQIGQTLEGTNVGDWFGRSISLSSDGRTLVVGAPYYNGNSNKMGSVHVYRFGSDGQWFEPSSILIGKSEDDLLGVVVALSGDVSNLVVSGGGFLRFFEADGDEWIEVGEETAYSENNYAAISRDGSTAMGGASVFDISCQQGTAPATPNPGLSPPSPAPVSFPLLAPVLSPSPTRTESMEPPPTGTAAEDLPTSAPRTSPDSGAMVQETFSDLSLSFNGVSDMSGPEIEMFELLTIKWFETFYVERSGRVLQTVTLDARNMQTTIIVTDQQVSTSEDGPPLVNKITYKQTISYTTDWNNVDAFDYITLPFVNVAAITEYGDVLKSEMTAFQGLQGPLPIPQYETNTDGEDSAIGVIVGASIGGAVVLILAAFVWIQVKKRKDDAGESIRAVHRSSAPVESQDQWPPSAAGLIVFDEQGEALAPRTLSVQAVLLESDNPTTLQKGTAEVQAPSAASQKPSPSPQELDTPVPEPMAVSSSSDSYVVQFKDQVRHVLPETSLPMDPDSEDELASESGRFSC